MRPLLALLVSCILAPAFPAAAAEPSPASAPPASEPPKIAPPASEQPASEPPEIAMTSGMTYIAETNVMTSVKDLETFADGIYGSKWETAKAARVDGFVIEKDAGKWTLTGWIFLREGVRGTRNRAIFFGDGRFEMTPPIELEKQQVRRFLGTDTVNQPIKQLYLRFTGADEQQLLESLTYSEAEAAKAGSENEDCKKWLEEVSKFLEKGESTQALERRRYLEFELALRSYERVLEPRKTGWLHGDMKIKVPESQDVNKIHLVGMAFAFDPDARVEVSLDGSFKHEKGPRPSRIAEFHAAGQHEGDLQWAGTSPYIEAEDAGKFEFSVPFHRIELDLTPGDKIDTRMVSDIDIGILKDTVKALTFSINQYTAIKSVSIDGKPMEFYQPGIPGNPDLHAPYVVVALPRKYAKGETMKVHVECESKIFERFDDATWQVNAELNWFPDPSPDLGDTPTVFDTTIRAPKGWTALANGLPGACAPEDVEAGKECFHYRTNIGIDFATINIANNMRADKGMSVAVDADKDGKMDSPIPIAIWTNSTAKREFPVMDRSQSPPRVIEYRSYNLSETGPDALGRAQVANKVYSDWFGPCPYDALTVTPHPKGHGRGSASLLCISQSAFLSTTAYAELASLNKTTFKPWFTTWFLSHEVAHQWWGGASRIRDGGLSQWFSEGFAQYGSFLVLEELDRSAGTNWFREALVQDREYLVKDDGHAHDIASLAYGSNRWESYENRNGYEFNRQEYMYGKGAMILHSLRMLARSRMGDPTQGDLLFKTAMRNFISECKGAKAPSNTDLRVSLEKTYDMPLDWFFKQWVFGLGIPKVTWSYDIAAGKDGGTTIRLRVKQTQGGEPFQFPLAVSLWQGKKELGFGYQWVGKADAEIPPIELPAGVNPDKVKVNDELGVLGIFKEVPWNAAVAGQ